jgi:tetratricopeptide (TPR) repeat protein
VHPRAISEVELDYEEGLELWKAGDPESARDALRYALSACSDNLWVHVALGRLALEEFKDAELARGHFGYAYELGSRAIPPGFAGRLPATRPNNRPFLEAIDGLARCMDALGRPNDAIALRKERDRLRGDAF